MTTSSVGQQFPVKPKLAHLEFLVHDRSNGTSEFCAVVVDDDDDDVGPTIFVPSFIVEDEGDTNGSFTVEEVEESTDEVLVVLLVVAVGVVQTWSVVDGANA